ncbi:MAG TPA: hypothetical protein VIB99_01120 [Candidatus Limnocylindrales bacterium]
MSPTPKPSLVVNPPDDLAFRADAERILDEGVESPVEFADRLRPQYPQIAVHPREIVAEPIVIWYVYRDGHWVNVRSEHDPSAAEQGLDSSDRRQASP